MNRRDPTQGVDVSLLEYPSKDKVPKDSVRGSERDNKNDDHRIPSVRSGVGPKDSTVEGDPCVCRVNVIGLKEDVRPRVGLVVDGQDVVDSFVL